MDKSHSRQQAPEANAISTAPVSGTDPAQEAVGNAAVADQMKVDGPMGRVWNRILGQAEGRTDTATMSFDAAALKKYLDKTLAFAEGEWFRGKKLSGASEALMEQLDTGKDGQVSWAEFQAFKAETLAGIAPGATAGSSEEEVRSAAGSRFDQLDTGRGDGQLNMGELQTGTKAALPKDTAHSDLVAQLGARLALDAVDTDQRGSAVADRTLSRDEWAAAAAAMAGITGQ